MSKFLNFKRENISLILVVFFGLLLRIYGINWDEGYHFHPDERMLMIVAERIRFFTQLDPDFFNYGSLPLYILKGISQLTDTIFKAHVATYDGMLYVGRSLSVIADLLVVVMIYRIGRLLFDNRHAAVFSSFLYALAFFPIQNSHFFVVDVFLNLFITILVYLLLSYLQNPKKSFVIVASIVFAAAITTKVTSIIFLPVIVLTLSLPYLKNFQLNKIIIHIFLFSLFSILFSFLFMPYAFLRYERFIQDIKLQIAMNQDPYIFPYTLQYVATLPYLYYLKNIAIWGAGPIIFTLVLLGFYEQLTTISFRKFTKQYLFSLDTKQLAVFVFYIWYLWYFLVIGRSAVKFMRYMLIIYPFLSLIAGYGLYMAIKNLKSTPKIVLIAVIFSLISLWTLAFVNIYASRPTRILASEWINNNVPVGSTIAVEHWDDRVPVNDSTRYNYVEMTLYDRPDNETKWTILNEKLKRANYIVIASNRLYVPLQRLDDCNKYRYCFPRTSKYYSDLFSGNLGFQKVAEFTSYPYLKIGSSRVEIIDDSADESFTVYDHPKVMVFKKKAK